MGRHVALVQTHGAVVTVVICECNRHLAGTAPCLLLEVHLDSHGSSVFLDVIHFNGALVEPHGRAVSGGQSPADLAHLHGVEQSVVDDSAGHFEVDRQGHTHSNWI